MKNTILLLAALCAASFAYGQTHTGWGSSGAATALILGSTKQSLGSTAATAAGQCLVSAGGGPYTWVAGSCAASASTVWSDLTAPGANLSLDMATYTTNFNYTGNWGAGYAFSITSNGSNASTGPLFELSTGASTNMDVFWACGQGASNCLKVDKDGIASITGSGHFTGNLTGNVTGNADTATNGVTSASTLTSTEIMTGAGSRGAQTNSGFTYLAGTLTGPAGLKVCSSDTGGPCATFSAYNVNIGPAGVSLTVTPDGTHPTLIDMVGNTNNPTIAANHTGWLGPPAATFTAYAPQLPSTGPTANQFLTFAAPDGTTHVALGTFVSGTPRACEVAWTGTGTANALQSGDDAAADNSCYNKLGVTETITAVYCRSSAASNTTTINPTFGADGTGTTILSGALTCGSSNAYSATGTVSNGALTDGSGINPVMGGTLTGTSIHMLVIYTTPHP